MTTRLLRLTLSTCLFFALLLGADQEAQAVPRTAVFVHETGPNGNRVFVYQLLQEKSKCRLRRIKGSPFVASPNTTLLAVDINSLTIAYSARDHLLFTAGVEGITVWRVAKNLRLARVNGSPFGGGPIMTVAVVREGPSTFVYGSAGFPGKGIRGFQVQQNGTLAEIPGSPFEATGGSFSGSVVVGDLLVAIKAGEFVINRGGALATFRAGADGSLTAGPRLPYDPDAFHPFLARKGSCVFLPEVNNRRLLGFSLDPATGALAGAPGSPFSVDPALAEGRLDMAVRGDLAFLLNIAPSSGKGAAQANQVNGDCTLTPLGPVQTLGSPAPIVAAISPQRRCLVTASLSQVRTFGIKRASGKLTRRATSKITAANLNGIAIGRR
jgi:hypothetical protein